MKKEKEFVEIFIQSENHRREWKRLFLRKMSPKMKSLNCDLDKTKEACSYGQSGLSISRQIRNRSSFWNFRTTKNSKRGKNTDLSIESPSKISIFQERTTQNFRKL